MASTAPKTHSPITPDNHAPIIEIALYFLMVTFILAVLIRFTIRLAIARSISIDDWISLASMVAGIGQCIAIATGIKDGLGKSEALLRSQQIENAIKSLYAGDWFYMLALGLAKVSVLLLLRRLAVDKLHKTVALYTAGAVCLWALAGIVTLAARCGSTLPWKVTSADQCINLRTFWIGMAPADILSEVVIITIPILMMIPVQVAMSKKAVIVVAFLFRVLVIGTTIARLFYIQPNYATRNFTFNIVDAEIMNQMVLSFTITTACIPCLKPFLDAFDSGRMAVMVENGRVGGSHSGSRSYPLRDLAYGNLGYGNSKSMVTSGIDKHGDDRDIDENNKYRSSSKRRKADNQPAKSDSIPNNGTAYPINEKDEGANTDAGSVASSSKSDQMIIKKDVSYTVQYEDSSNSTPPPPNARKQGQHDSTENFIFQNSTGGGDSRKRVGSSPGMAM